MVADPTMSRKEAFEINKSAATKKWVPQLPSSSRASQRASSWEGPTGVVPGQARPAQPSPS